MSNLEKTLFQLKFTAKTLNRQAKKAQKDENSEKSRLKKALQQGNNDGARIYASNAIRKKSEALNLLRLASRIDAVASRVETAVTMRQVTGNMTSVVKGMDKAMETMNLERVRAVPVALAPTLTPSPQISLVMDKFESQFTDLDVQTSYMEDAMGSTTAVSTPQDQVDSLMRQMADEANIQLEQDLAAKDLASVPDLRVTEAPVGEEDAQLADRLRALRPAT
ncbi:vacuolar assembly protein DID2 [Auriscalpium vulgare]|uniref:Vacuolar assembly protein DID2 n=1 Tax=Auriscalpium vulgare TaxID=40419 RepID=A0ACB8RDH9_9AGAM|nr:vacuolar assembly protein DID2 [Auriscalpium vulgare]